MRLPAALAAAALAALSSLAGCADQPAAEPAPTAPSTTAAPTAPSSTAEPTTTATPTTTPEPAARREQRRRGVDVSHHQGAIDWRRVAGDDISFAYLKATEGSTFTDPRFAENWAGARAAGLTVGGYHYFTLCSPPEPQADHFVATLAAVGADRRSLPPVVDLELIGNCDPPPDRATMLTAARAFIDRVESATGREVVVYFHPDFEAAYSLVDELDRRLWVRRVGARRPPGDWWLWQRSDRAEVAGIATPVDLDVMRLR